MKAPAAEPTVTIKEAAERLSIHERTMLRWIYTGVVVARRYGRTWRVPVGVNGLPIAKAKRA